MRRLIAFVVLLGLLAPRAAYADDDVVAREKPARRGEGSSRGGAGTPLLVTGTVFAGLGMSTLVASGITWLVAASAAARLDEDCPNKHCVEGSSGADALERARSAERASAVLFAIGLPVMTGGCVVLLYFERPKKARRSLTLTPAIGPRHAGADLSVRF